MVFESLGLGPDGDGVVDGEEEEEEVVDELALEGPDDDDDDAAEEDVDALLDLPLDVDDGVLVPVVLDAA
jgi:hypothetical protein